MAHNIMSTAYKRMVGVEGIGWVDLIIGKDIGLKPLVDKGSQTIFPVGQRISHIITRHKL